MAVQYVFSAAAARKNANAILAIHLNGNISDLGALTYEYGITRGERAAIQWAAQHKVMGIHLQEMKGVLETTDDRSLFEDLAGRHGAAGERFAFLREYDAAAGGTAPPSSLVRNNLVNSLVLALQEMQPAAEKVRALNHAAALRSGRNANIASGLLLLSLVLWMPPVLYVIVKKFTGPIDNLLDGMGVIASGNLGHRLSAGSGDEIGALSDGFNAMAESLKQVTVSRDELALEVAERARAQQEIARLNEELEQRVRDRTVELEQRGEELQQANVHLQELDRLKSMFIAAMSHELRTPLNSIIGFSSILLEEWVGPLNEEQKKNLAAVLRYGKLLLSLINDVIDLSKIEAGQLKSAAEEFDLQVVIAEAAALLRSEAERKGLVLEVDVAPLVVHSDRQRLHQCLVNLISNALKFTERGRVIVRAALVQSLDAEDIPGLVEIEVRDTGIGLREEDLGKLFSAFVRIDSPLRAKVLGTGLGLYLVKKIAEDLLKGQVAVRSVFGEGSSFFLRIPLRLPRGDGR